MDYSLRDLVAQELERSDTPLNARQIADRLGAKMGSVTETLGRLVDLGRASRVERVTCFSKGKTYTVWTYVVATKADWQTIDIVMRELIYANRAMGIGQAAETGKEDDD